MKEHGILFKGEMVRAILEDRKTQTRREAKPQPSETVYVQPKYKVGDHLYVKETFGYIQGMQDFPTVYRADCTPRTEEDSGVEKWKPSIFMPKKESRIWLAVTEVRGQKLLDISEEDAMAEGIRQWSKDGKLWKFCVGDVGDEGNVPWVDMARTARDAYFQLWDSINGKGSSEANPWVWAYTFKRIEKGGK